MRTGYATSACAAASAAAALRALVSQQPAQSVTIDLPVVKGVTFSLVRCEVSPEMVCCGIIKDAGDDPDVTNGMEIQALVRWSDVPGVTLTGGSGIGRVTLPGLPVKVGEAAINPGPRRLILQVMQRELTSCNIPEGRGVEVIVQAPRGEEIAQKTMNPRLGIVGGISILGTDGLVRPYSAPAFRASLYYELRVAYENGYREIGLTTGKRSFAALKALLDDQRGLGVLDVGDELGYPIEHAHKMGFNEIHIGGMIGKLSKLAAGRYQTHVQEGEIDFDFLSKLAKTQGASDDLCERIRLARTAHAVQKWLEAEGLHIELEITRQAAAQVFEHVDSAMNVNVYLFSLNGELMGSSRQEIRNDD